MLVLGLSERERIEIATPGGKVTIYFFGDDRIGIDAPKRWGITRRPLPAPQGENR